MICLKPSPNQVAEFTPSVLNFWFAVIETAITRGSIDAAELSVDFIPSSNPILNMLAKLTPTVLKLDVDSPLYSDWATSLIIL